ncbi:MAG: RNA pseudouridine synthase [Flavobacteriaceae bacterium]|nr:MAG: RNA pseudouridine synthase [Flavobacteriaceae bacterium]
MIVIETHIVPTQKIPIRIQEYLVEVFKTIPTKSGIKKAIKKELIFVDGSATTTAKMIVGGEEITLYQSEENKSLKRLNLKLEVLFEDDYLAIINKPAGILVSGNKFKTIANGIAQNLKPSLQIDTCKPKPVHRLDYPTTGLLLIGKTKSAILFLNKLFENKEIQKEYIAVTIGKMNPLGIIEIPVDEKESVSHFEVLKTVNSKRFEFLNLVKLTPKTGRRHQLRKHLSAIGNPILGDKEYGFENLILNGKGLYLHAARLNFLHPITKEEMDINKEVPNKFRKIFSE